MRRYDDAELVPCPLCKHKAYMFLEVEKAVKRDDGNYDDFMVDEVRCAYCGCRLSAPYSKGKDHDWGIKYLQDSWNNRAEYCQYCGALAGKATECPECGSNLLVNG